MEETSQRLINQTKSPTVSSPPHLLALNRESSCFENYTSKYPINIKLAMKQISVLYIASIWIPLKRLWDLIWRLIFSTPIILTAQHHLMQINPERSCNVSDDERRFLQFFILTFFSFWSLLKSVSKKKKKCLL